MHALTTRASLMFKLRTTNIRFGYLKKNTIQELEAIEEQWRSESNDLMTMVSRLQDENRRILKQQNSGSSSPNSSPSHDIHHDMTDKLQRLQLQHAAHRPNATAADGKNDATDVPALQRLRAQLEKQRNDLKIKDMDLQAKGADVDNVSDWFCVCVIRFAVWASFSSSLLFS